MMDREQLINLLIELFEAQPGDVQPERDFKFVSEKSKNRVTLDGQWDFGKIADGLLDGLMSSAYSAKFRKGE